MSRNIEYLRYSNIGNSSKELSKKDYFIDEGMGVDSLSHRAYYFNMEDAVTPAGKASLLILGNSRALIAFPPRIMDEFSERHNFRYFNMAFGYGKTSKLPREIMDRNKIFPKVVIVNADGFFENYISGFASKFHHKSRFEKFKEEIESRMLFNYSVHVRIYVPHFSLKTVPASAFFRARRTGSWHFWGENHSTERYPVDDESPNDKLEEAYFSRAADFHQYLKKGGTQLILTHIPTTVTSGSPKRAREIAQRLGVPFIRPEIEGLQTTDRSHLDAESVTRFANAFFEEFIKTDYFKLILNSK